jgi:hypothetical protein
VGLGAQAEHVHPTDSTTWTWLWDARVSRLTASVGFTRDVSVYRVPSNLAENYGTPVSFHLFLRYRPFAEPLHAVH